MNSPTQYKLLQWYPNLPKEWKTYKGEAIVTKRGGVYVGDMTKLSIDEVENNPEFWERVETKDYEILTFKSQGTVYRIDESVFPSEYSMKKYIENFEGSIHSVKRLHDGEVFSVDEYVRGQSNSGKIYEFLIADGHLHVLFGDEWSNFITNIEHTKLNHIFTTNDGVDIYEGDEYFFTSPKDLIIESNTAHRGSGKVKGLLYFSNKDSAQEYVDNHKPIYSKAEVEEALREFKGKAIFQRGKFRRRLDELKQ